MITGRYPVQALAPSSNPHVKEEYLQSVRIQRAEEEVRLRETQLIAQENGLELDLEGARLYTQLDDNYLTELESLSPKLTPAKEQEATPAKELEKFVAYGTEIKYLPLFKYLQVSNKFVGTEEWRVARQEYFMSKAFERYKEACEVQMELQSLNNNSNNSGVSSCNRRKVWWDGVLEEAKWMAIDFREEREWKRQMAIVLAEEAALYAKCKMKRQPEKKKYFYEPSLLPELLKKLTIQPLEPKTLENDLTMQSVEKEKEVVSGPFVMGKGWKEAEDQRLREISKLYRGNMDLIAEELNYYFHQLGHHKRTPAMCQERLRYFSSQSSSSITGVGGVSVLEMLKEGERHFTRFSLMQSARGKLVLLTRVTPLTTLKPVAAGTKRPSSGTTVHPSHDAAVKRATQNITRLLTPGELALRRMQRMRQLMEGMRQPNNQQIPSTQSSVQPSTQPSAHASAHTSMQGTPLKKQEHLPRDTRSTTPTPSNRSKPPSRPSTPKK